MEQITVLHIFSGDLWAGAEVMVYHLLGELRKLPNTKIIAISLNEGVLAENLRKADIETYVIPEDYQSFVTILLNVHRLIKGRKIDAIHSHRYKENLLALVLSRFTATRKLVATLHGMPEPSPKAGHARPGLSLKTRFDYFILKRYFTHVVAVSQDIRRALVEGYGFLNERVDVIYNGIPQPALCARNLRSSDVVEVGTVGRMTPVKGFDLFLEMAAKVREQTDRVCFSILGDGPLKNELINKARELKVEDCVKFLAARPNPVPDYYCSLAVYVNTSLHEGIPLSVLEAMACGCPVIAPQVGGLPEIISHGQHGVLIKERDANVFASWCLRLLHEKELRMTLVQNATERIARYFSSTRMAKSYIELYSR